MKTIDMDAERKTFESSIWAYYANLKTHGWSAPGEGDFHPDALFWKEPSGKYGVLAIEAAWNGWKMRAAL